LILGYNSGGLANFIFRKIKNIKKYTFLSSSFLSSTLATMESHLASVFANFPLNIGLPAVKGSYT